MLITVKTLTGHKLQLEITDDMTIYNLKELVSEKEGMDIPQIRMIFRGNQLNDTLKVSDMKISPGDIIHLVLSLRGG